MSVLRWFVLVCVVITLIGCEHEGKLDMQDELIHCVYNESDRVFPNPERGFYSSLNFHSSTASPIKLIQLKANRTYNRTLLYTGYYLTDYMESDIAEEYLQLIRTNMQVLRDGGAKCILRFAYKTDMYETGHPWDASPEWVARHIEQLKPIMQEYGDVILCLQAGFVGVWGEWAFTDHFVQGPQTVEDYALRKDVMTALLDAMPVDRQVAVRTPMYKKKMYLDSYADTLTLETAFNGSDVARIGGHNDCFGADGSDMGTFLGTDTRNFWKTETRYLMMGGETCQVSGYCKCKRSLQDVADYHWTYLNSGYNSNVLNGWRNEGCFDEIERRLGYRLVLKETHHTRNPIPGEDFRIIIKIQNNGYAAPANPRAVELVLVDSNGEKIVYEQPDIDPRYWFAGETITIDRVIKLPENASGKYKVYLNLPDPKETLHDNPLFSIRLANENIWNMEMGYNRVAVFTI